MARWLRLLEFAVRLFCLSPEGRRAVAQAMGVQPARRWVVSEEYPVVWVIG